MHKNPEKRQPANNSSDDQELNFKSLHNTNDNRKKNHNYRETESMKRKKKTRLGGGEKKQLYNHEHLQPKHPF